ncbi:16S rRNA (cytosine(1402)-N(4))-methyltransferase RsmH [Trueperella bialowiezensis]|uniref:Ribosomal RNA small subunit methyltransferase H n=1 Tax=Trueperella bialowiezensis TaxID=312285 RepID=A0A448PCF2_9ACTO|nr:16S rRNA (cytosine(1402)-N(4))-methyltransferase RsmH [Trueperella bialowiezensis]VEI12608.1 Ribosomal RNA small subunit methyltransferase H [Trueperella bialowiezensis]
MLTADNDALHVPVLTRTVIDLLAPALSGESALLIDCTLGMGGHAEAFLAEFPNVTVVGIDRDPQAIELASARLERFGERFRAVHATYDDVDLVASDAGGYADAILMDLGVSSLQLDAEERGFSYSVDAPLDMRMDSSGGMSAKDLLATASAGEIARILRVYGEEKFASRIADAIVRRRVNEPLTRTGELVDIVRESIPAAARRTGGNPAKRTFQALRIAVNDELAVLEAALPRAIESLRVGGRIAVESYQSLEDRIVKEAFAKGATSTTPAGLPVELETHKPYLRQLTRGALKAPDAEIARNPRSASVRLRAVERVSPTPPHMFNPQNYRGVR